MSMVCQGLHLFHSPIVCQFLILCCKIARHIRRAQISKNATSQYWSWIRVVNTSIRKYFFQTSRHFQHHWHHIIQTLTNSSKLQIAYTVLKIPSPFPTLKTKQTLLPDSSSHTNFTPRFKIRAQLASLIDSDSDSDSAPTLSGFGIVRFLPSPQRYLILNNIFEALPRLW